ncbi:hypothetical protein E2562_019836 [Oryza meyeriana var. granulata]|uniref:Uncharacterized protein n=1 Tax=Oryza meyeriana var. granulata TaxID=110450 RepID=A0A6G1CS38_9ORYZ|nr:hypothetical protein E2562_019836 [Oryza meyeriana var. granulata]
MLDAGQGKRVGGAAAVSSACIVQPLAAAKDIHAGGRQALAMGVKQHYSRRRPMMQGTPMAQGTTGAQGAPMAEGAPAQTQNVEEAKAT